MIEKILLDDIKRASSIMDKEVNKEYIYYESSKGNFRVGLCYEDEYSDENVQGVKKSKVCGIDYSKEIK